MTAKQREESFTADQWKTCKIEGVTCETEAEARKLVSEWKKKPECMRARWQTRFTSYHVTLWILG